MWISNAPFAHVAVVWAKMKRKNSRTDCRRGMEGFSTPETHNKWSFVLQLPAN